MERSGKGTVSGRADQVADLCVVSRVRMLGRVITALYQEELDPYQMTVSQFNILTALIKLGPTSPSRVCALLRVEKSTLSRNLLLLQRSGWITSEAHGRNNAIEISERGEKVFVAAFAGWKKAQERAKRLLGPQGLKAVNDAVTALGPVVVG